MRLSSGDSSNSGRVQPVPGSATRASTLWNHQTGSVAAIVCLSPSILTGPLLCRAVESPYSKAVDDEFERCADEIH